MVNKKSKEGQESQKSQKSDKTFLRPMKVEDLPIITALEKQSFPQEAWNEDEFTFEIEEHPFSHPYVLEVEGVIAGYIIYWIIFEQAQIASIAIEPAFRRQGLSKILLEKAIDHARKEGAKIITLEVRPSNLSARALYDSFGFRFLHTAKHYYENGEDAFVLGLDL